MRLMTLATALVLGLCLAYSHYLNASQQEVRSASYDGPAIFVTIRNTVDQGASEHWILVCWVNGARIAFAANDPWVRRAAASLRPEQPVHLRYELPACETAYGSELGPPTLRGLEPLERPAGSPTAQPELALNTRQD